MVIPTTYMALRDPEVYERPDEFDPERYYTGDAEVKGAKNYLVFGTGPHYCLGQQYAQLNLALMLGKASLLMDWKHHPTPKSEEIKVFATIFPMVSLFFFLWLCWGRVIREWSRGSVTVIIVDVLLTLDCRTTAR